MQVNFFINILNWLIVRMFGIVEFSVRSTMASCCGSIDLHVRITDCQYALRSTRRQVLEAKISIELELN